MLKLVLSCRVEMRRGLSDIRPGITRIGEMEKDNSRVQSDAWLGLRRSSADMLVPEGGTDESVYACLGGVSLLEGHGGRP